MNTEIDIASELHKDKRKLEDDISKLLDEFYQKYGLSNIEVNCETGYRCHTSYKKNISAWVKCTI